MRRFERTAVVAELARQPVEQVPLRASGSGLWILEMLLPRGLMPFGGSLDPKTEP